jgi:hypothetical protein
MKITLTLNVPDGTTEEGLRRMIAYAAGNVGVVMHRDDSALIEALEMAYASHPADDEIALRLKVPPGTTEADVFQAIQNGAWAELDTQNLDEGETALFKMLTEAGKDINE